MINKDMKLIPKAQYGAQFIAQSDNTRVAKPIIQERIPYKLKPNEFYFIDKKTGKRIIGRQKQEVISSDNCNTKQRKQDQTIAKQIPIMLYKFRNLLKYGMGVLPVDYKNK